MSNGRTIFWLLVVTCAAVALNVFVTWRVPTVRHLPRLTLVDPSFRAEAVAIVKPDEPTVALAHKDRWRLVQPFAAAADESSVLKMLDAFETVRIDDSHTDAELQKLGRTRADFGLDVPSVRVVLSGPNAATNELAFGRWTSPLSNAVYAAVSGVSSVFVVPSNVLNVVRQGVGAFRLREVFPHAVESIRGFDLRKAGAKPVAFVRAGESWRVDDRVASERKVNEFLSSLIAARARDFLWPNGGTNEESVVSEARLAGYGLDAHAALALTLRLGDGSESRILFGNDIDHTHVCALIHQGAAIVSLDASLKAAAQEGLDAFVENRLFPFDESAVSAYSLTEGGTTYVVAHGEDGTWRLDAPIAAPADPAFAEAVLSRILALTSDACAREGVAVSVSTNREPRVVAARSVLGDGRFENLRSPEILRIETPLVRRLVTVDGRGGKARPPQSVVYSRERKVWSSESEEGGAAAVRVKSVEAILASLSSLRAVRIVKLRASVQELAKYGLDKPRYTVSVDTEKAGSVRRNIFIGAETKEGSYATVGSAESVFILPKKTVDALLQPLFAAAAE